MTEHQTDPPPCSWCAERELPCPEGHLLHRAEEKAAATLCRMVDTLIHLAQAAKEAHAAQRRLNRIWRRLVAAEIIDTWPRRLWRWIRRSRQ